MLKIADDPAGADVSDAVGTGASDQAGTPMLPVKTQPGTAAAMSTGSSKVCAITGKPAKYRDPISGLPYADLAAFKELRKLHPDPKAAEKAAEKAAAAAPAAEPGAETAAKG